MIAITIPIETWEQTRLRILKKFIETMKEKEVVELSLCKEIVKAEARAAGLDYYDTGDLTALILHKDSDYALLIDYGTCIFGRIAELFWLKKDVAKTIEDLNAIGAVKLF